MYAIAIENLCKTYANRVQALNHVDLTIAQGDFFALLGPNGAGKSTLIGILSSLVMKSSGNVNIMGVDLSTQTSLAKAHLGVIPQEINLNIFENAEQVLLNQAAFQGIPRRLAKPRAQSLLEQVNLLDKRHAVISTLSGGMKRRLMIARALIHDPDIILLDEPTAGVDVEIRHSMWNLLRQLNQQGKTIILTTHYLEEAENLCKNIAIIDHGQIVINTSMKQLLDQLEFETVVLYLIAPQAQAPQLTNYNCHLVEDDVLEVALNRQQSLTTLLAELAEQGVTVQRMRNKTNRLESLFMNLLQHEGIKR